MRRGDRRIKKGVTERGSSLTENMASGRRMCWTQLWLLVFLACYCLTDGSPLEVMSAPNLLRVGTAENIFVECQDCTGGDITVHVTVMNHPTKNKVLASTSVTLTSANNFQAFAQVTIPVGDFSKDPSMKQYVHLQAQFPDRLLEKVVLVSFQSGYIFIQTDKTIYTPDSTVHYRIFAVTPRMEPVERDSQNDASVVIELMTPEGIIFDLAKVILSSGIYSGQYRLDGSVSPGLWKVVAKFQSNLKQSYSAEFEVKEYVMPSFEVKLTPERPFFHVDSTELTVNIKATYLFGEHVDGMAYVIFGVILEGHKKSFPSSLQRVPIQTGNGAVTLRREHITQAFRHIHALVGGSIFLTASVVTESGGELVEAELKDIQIVTSPYTIHFKNTPKYFKPGLTFDVVVEVMNPDDSPAAGVVVIVDPGQVQSLTTANGLARTTVITGATADRLTITAKTNDPQITPDRQASATMVALLYTTNTNSYIQINVDASIIRLGETLKTMFYSTRPLQNEITYLILSRGQLVKYGRIKTGGQFTISVTIPITKELLPSFRIIAYYHTNNNEVVSDSVWVDVEDSCMGSLKLEPTRHFASYEPRKRFELKVTGDPEAVVGLVAVGKGVYTLNNKLRLTQKKVWDIVEKSDTGCTPGGGKDGMNVFFDAGLLFESSSSGTPHRQDLKCPSHSRRKRAEEDDISYLDSIEIISRTQIAERWLWMDLKLPTCPHHQSNCDTTSRTTKFSLPDSITTWQFTGISLSRTHGICVANPLEIIVRKDFFIDLKLPYSAVRGEQIEIKAILHNYSPDPITVRVELMEEADVCSAAFKRGKFRQEINIGAETTRSVPFIIIPMKQGEYNIAVKAAVRDSWLHDGITRRLRVVPEGVLIKSPYVITLDPANKGVGGKQDEIFNSRIPLKDLVPDSPTSTIISLTGREQIVVMNPISGISMGDLIRLPSGDGESAIIYMSQTVVATMYLNKTNQWETVGFEKRNEALNYIKNGYERELIFRKRDGSFAVFTSSPSSTWLTAYVAKVFAMAVTLVPVDTTIICDAIKFLILYSQLPNGMFREAGHVYHTMMMGDVRGTNSDVSMTAFCLIAMQESRSQCDDSVNSLQGSINKAVAYLESHLPRVTNPYAVAMTSYALANENKLNREILTNFIAPDLSHWPVPKGHVYTLEATAYALLALVKVKAFEDARPVVRWLNQQRKVGGGYGSTQATMMVYQAVAEYWTNAKEQQYDLNVDILLPGRSQPLKYNINNDNHYVTRTSKVNRINEDISVTATGHGEATLTVVSMFYTLPKEKESDCQKFNLSVQLLPESDNDDEKVYKLRIDVMYVDKERNATMTILDIGLLTGFTVNTMDLDLLSKGRARTIAKYEMNTVLSERGSLIIYLDKVSHTQPEEISFRIHQVLKVGVMQPAAVSVYEYYDQEQCMKFYHPERRNGQLLRLCKDDVCTCAEGNCPMQRKGDIDSNYRIEKAREVTVQSRIDSVYKVRVESFSDVVPTVVYTVRIMEVIREGIDSSLLGKLCHIISHQSCQKAISMEKDKTYLLMGSSRHILQDSHSLSCQYVLDEKAWIEYWPTEEECQTAEHRHRCLGLQELFDLYTLFPCS